MSNFPSRYFPHTRPLATTLLLALAAGFSAPFIALPPAQAAAAPPAGTVELSPSPVNVTQAVSPNIAVTFDDSGSMASAFMGDNRPFDDGSWNGKWRCAGVIDDTGSKGALSSHAMNGVYYNPNVTYLPPHNADPTSFPNADATLQNVWNDGVTANRPLSPSGASDTTDFTNQGTKKKPTYWQCYYDGGYTGNLGQDGNTYSTTAPVVGGGPYYYRYTGPALTSDKYGNPDATSLSNLYKNANWTAVAVPNTNKTMPDGTVVNQWQNWANWWAYYRTRNQMARTSISRAFGQLGAPGNDGKSFGSTLRAAWQNLYTSDDFYLQDNTIISELIDGNSPQCDPTDSGTTDPVKVGLQSGTTFRTPPNCYRSAFFNWIFSVDATGNTPSRAATIRAGKFFIRGNGNTGGTGDLHDPYWQPPTSVGADGNELFCRQNFHMLVTDGYSNESDPTLPGSAANANSPFKDVITNYTLPDGTKYSSSAAESRIIWNNRGGDYQSNMANIAFNYWATDLRPDLYNAAKSSGITNPVPPYMPDSTTGVVAGATSAALEQYFNPNNDPANWPHLVQYMVTLGVSGDLVHSDDYDCISKPNDACSLRTGATTSDGSVGWPKLVNNSPEGIDDVWHATVASRGNYFNAGNPQDLVDQLGNILSNIATRQATPTTGAINASVVSAGALAFNTSYRTDDWTGTLKAYPINSDGSVSTTLAWDAGDQLTKTAANSRNILTASKNGSGNVVGVAFQDTLTFASDTTEKNGLLTPALGASPDSLANRIDYLRGDRSLEIGGTYRKRNSLLGAIIDSQPLYVSFPAGGYTNTWPKNSPENGGTAQTYDDFASKNSSRPGTLYVGANDGMLHAFAAPAPACRPDGKGGCTYDDYGDGGAERWAFIPRAVYGNLGNLTSVSNFKYAPTVDASPRSRDVFFSDNKWHTLLVGGVGLGGRGVYALDITDPKAVTEGSASSSVLWEFDSDRTPDAGCVAIGIAGDTTGCRATDLGYIFGAPNIGRLQLSNGKWVVLVSNGYFPDCSKGDKPSPCSSAQAPKDSSNNPYSALFVLDAQTGAMIAELKTPTNISGVTSFGLGTPVLGDYDNNQVDDVAFAGDLQGNVWRFDLADSKASNWGVNLIYQGVADSSGNQGVQPVTVMPRLFPDPTTNRFIVVFGTGKYLGAADNTSTSAATQSVYGVRDQIKGGAIVTYKKTDLVAQTLSESVDTDPKSTTYGITLRSLTNYAVPVTAGGWYFDLQTTSGGKVNDAGERMVVTAGAIFTTNTALITTLIPGSADPCNPSAKGAFMSIDATTGGAGAGQSSLGGYPYVGGRVDNVPTSGSLPVASSLGGGSLPIPGLVYSGAATPTQVSVDAPMWRRRSWQEIEIEQ